MKFYDLVNMVLTESNYHEAWELFHLGKDDGNVRKFVKDVLKINNDDPDKLNKDPKIDTLAKNLGSYMDTLPVTDFPWNQISNLKTIDQNWVKEMLSIQNKPNVEEEYVRLMDRRDKEGGERPGGKLENSKLFNLVKSKTAEPVVILKLPTGMYAVGGRTRMFAAVASKTNIRAIILTSENLLKFFK
jgi:hypothetical protein